LTVAFVPSGRIPVALVPSGHFCPPLGVVGVGHEVDPLPDVRSADARRAQIRRPNGVTRSFQISRNSVEPREAICARNLLSKDDWRAALADEPEPFRPEMPSVFTASLPAGGAERLARTTSRPNGKLVWNACESERVAPDADSGEEVALPPPGEVFRFEVDDASFFDESIRDVSLLGKVAEPASGVGLDLVVDGDAHDLRALAFCSALCFRSRAMFSGA
jgi:hypothetical protein